MMKNPSPGKQPPVFSRGMELFNRTILHQKEFWCPICDTWFNAAECETAVGSPFLDQETKRLSVIVFGCCTKCVESRSAGEDLAVCAKASIDERTARRAAAGEFEPTEIRRKYVVMKDQGFRK